MKTQISKDNFDPEKRYSGVYQQQGRMLTDADWNELVDIIRHHLEEALLDVVGSGAPRERGFWFELIHALPEDEPRLKPGYLYVDGIQGRVLPDDQVSDKSTFFRFQQQLDFPKSPALPETDGSYIFFADLWERPLTALEDSGLLDPGLHGADTCTRTRTVTQIKWCRKDQEAQLTAAPAKGNAPLTLALRMEAAATDPCDPCAAEVVLDERVGNYLFRVEVHSAELDRDGNLVRLTLKWSRENGAEQYPADDVPPDFKEDHWVYEFFNNTSELHSGWNPVGTHSFPDRPELEPKGFPDNPDISFSDYPWVRRWDGYCILEKSGSDWKFVKGKDKADKLTIAGNPDDTGHGSVHLDNDRLKVFLEHLELELTLKDKIFVAGDYWMARVREAVDHSGDEVLSAKPPAGIKHHYLKLCEARRTMLARRRWSLVPLPGEERRQFAFPPLTDLNAREVGYTVPACAGPAPTVNSLLKDALGAAWPDSDDNNPSVRDILDTLLCHADAGTIPFRSSCDNGLYPADIRTIDDALQALCNIRAAHVGYRGSAACDFLNQPDINTVQDALDALCSRPSGGGCRVVVAPEDMLDEVIHKLLQEGKNDICLCLLPGSHDLQDGIEIVNSNGRMTLDITGCGHGTRLLLRDKPLQFSGIDTVNIRNLNILGSAPLQEVFVFKECGKIIMQFVQLSAIIDAGGALGFINNAESFILEKSLFVPAYEESFKIPSLMFEIHEGLFDLFSRPSPLEFYEMLPKVTSSIMEMDQDRKEKLAEDIIQRMDEIDYQFSERERRSYQEFCDCIISEESNLAKTGLKTDNIRTEAVRVNGGTALVMKDGPADITLTGNDLAGDVSFYGRPGADPLSQTELKQLNDMVAEGAVTFSSTGATLHAGENLVTRFNAGADMTMKIRKILDEGNGILKGVVHNAFIRENELTGVHNEFIFKNLHLTSNSFESRFIGAGEAICDSAIYIGNRGGGDTVLLDITHRSEKTANLGLNIS